MAVGSGMVAGVVIHAAKQHPDGIVVVSLDGFFPVVAGSGVTPLPVVPVAGFDAAWAAPDLAISNQVCAWRGGVVIVICGV